MIVRRRRGSGKGWLFAQKEVACLFEDRQRLARLAIRGASQDLEIGGAHLSPLGRMNRRHDSNEE